MARSQVREVSGPSAIQGIAQPVNTYVRPADPGRNSLADLADGLAAFDQGLQAFMGKRKAEQDEDDKAKAIRDFHANNQVSYGDAVRQGLIPASASKSYVEWYKRSQGQLAGLKLQDKFVLDYQQWDGRATADSAGFSQFVSKWMHDNVGEDQDPDFLKGLAPNLEQLSMSGLDTFIKERDSRLKEGARSTQGALITDNLVRTANDGKATGQTDWKAFWDRTMALRDEAISKGELSEDYDKLIVDSVLLQAETERDDSILKVLDNTLPGKDKPISYDPEVRAKIQDTKDRINSRLASAATTEAAALEKKEKLQQEAWWTEAVDHLSKDEPVPDELIQNLSRRDGEARMKIARYKKEYMDLDTAEDPADLLNVYSDIYAGKGKDYVLAMRQNGTIQTPETFKKAMDLVESVQKANQADGVFSSATFKQYQKFILDQTSTMDAFGNTPLTAEGMEADYDFRTMVLQWDAQNPQAGVLEREKSIREIGETIKSRLQDDPNAVNSKMYVSEADQAKAAQEAQEEPQQPQEVPAQEGGYSSGGAWDYIKSWFGGDDAQQQQPQEAPPAAPSKSDEQSAIPGLEALPEARRNAVVDFAKRKGITPDEANRLLHDRVQKLMGDAPDGVDPTVTNSVSQDAKDKLTALFKDPPQVERLEASGVPVSPLLDLIGNTEGTDRGAGYNETLGYGAFTGGPVDLVNMTLDDVDALQTRMLQHPDNTYNASPVGRFQIVQKTLRQARKDLGLSGSEKFTPELQQKIAMHLLEGRGLSKWQSGEITTEQFMKNLENEWSSLPGHKSALRGALDGIQVASTDPEAGFREYFQGQSEGAKDLVTSTKRGYQPDLDHIHPELATKVSDLQAQFGKTLPIVSGFRDPERNAKAGGAKKSQHMHGNAVDIDVSNLPQAERIRLIRMAREAGFGGIGVYANSIHLDIGPRRAWGPSHHHDSIPGWAKKALS